MDCWTYNSPSLVEIATRFAEKTVDLVPEKIACTLIASSKNTEEEIVKILSFLENASVSWSECTSKWFLDSKVYSDTGVFKDTSQGPQTPQKETLYTEKYKCDMEDSTIELISTSYTNVSPIPSSLCFPERVEMTLHKNFSTTSRKPLRNIKYTYSVCKRWTDKTINLTEKKFLENDSDSTFIEISARPAHPFPGTPEIRYIALSVMMKMQDLLCFLGRGRLIMPYTCVVGNEREQ